MLNKTATELQASRVQCQITVCSDSDNDNTDRQMEAIQF